MCIIYRYGSIAQLVRVLAWHARGHWFESSCFHQKVKGRSCAVLLLFDEASAWSAHTPRVWIWFAFPPQSVGSLLTDGKVRNIDACRQNPVVVPSFWFCRNPPARPARATHKSFNSAFSLARALCSHYVCARIWYCHSRWITSKCSANYVIVLWCARLARYRKRYAAYAPSRCVYCVIRRIRPTNSKIQLSCFLTSTMKFLSF